jgi:ketosteroid isomerase-like protein
MTGNAPQATLYLLAYQHTRGHQQKSVNRPASSAYRQRLSPERRRWAGWMIRAKAGVAYMTSQPTSEHAQAAISAAHQELMASFASGDAAGVGAVYAGAAQLLPAYSAAIAGQGAIQAFWQGCLDMGICSLQRTCTELDLLAATANEMGHYILYGRNGKVLDVGKYVVIWKVQSGQWKIHRDIWTSNLPPGP